MPTRLRIISVLLLLAPTCSWARPTETEHLTVELVSDTDSVAPGRPLSLGIHFEMQKQWHIYWRNPGDSGEPPRVRWKLPAGFQAGEIDWPAPARLGSGSVIDYGYEEPVLLSVEMQTPETLALGGSVTFSAAVSWLVCKDICVPGKADLTLSLPVRTTPASVSGLHRLFEEAKARVPKPMPREWKVYATSDKDRFLLTIHGVGLTKASFFPLEVDQVDNAAEQTVTALPDGVRLTLKKSEQLVKTPVALEGVLEVRPGRAYVVSAPVRLFSERPALQ